MIDTDFPRATTISGDVTDPQSPYAPLLTDLRAGFGRWRERDDASTAESCAEVIWDSIHADVPPMRVVVGEDAASEYETAVAVDARRYRVAVEPGGVDTGASSPGAGPSGPDAAPVPVPGPSGVPGALSGPVVAVPGSTPRAPARPAPPPLASAFTVPADAGPGGAYGGGAYGGPGGGAFG
jgi:hypothetical protein